MSDDAAPSACMSDTDWTIVDGESVIKEISGATLKLPYEVLNEAKSMLHDALEELSRLVAAEDWDLLPRPLEDLENLVRMRIHLCPGVLQKLITLLYHLCTIDPFALPYVRSRAASFLALLLKKNKNTINKDFQSFELDPTPLFWLIDSILFPPRRLPKSIPSSSTVGSLIFLARRSRRYFTRGSLERIYEGLTVDYDEFDPDRMARFICQFSIFNSPSTLADLFKYLQPSSRVWAVNCKRFECLTLHLLARYAKYCPNLDQLEEHDFAFYYSVIMRHLKLSQPENNLQEKEKILYRHKTSVGAVKDQVGGAVKAFAKFIAHSLMKSAAGRESLRIFLCGMDSYFYPSNTGGWTNELSFFLLELCKDFAKLASKTQQDPKVLGVIAKVVAIVWPAVRKLCFAKNPFVVLNAVNCAKYLMYLHADVLIKDILTTSDYTLSALSEPHRTLSCIALLSRTARVQIEGVIEDKDSTGVSILSLLPACVFGLDPNDPFKTATTLNLFASVFSCLRLHPPHALLSEGFCEELITGILKQSFDYIESSATASQSEQTSLLEKAINEAFGHVWSLLLSQVSENLWTFAFERVESFVMEPKGGAALASLLIKACKDGNAQRSFDRLLPVLVEKSDRLLASGRGADARQSDESCGSLIWYLSCMFGLVRQSGDSALAHGASIKDLLLKFATLRQAQCVQLAGKIIKALSRSLIDYYPLSDSPSLPSDPCAIAIPSARISDANLTWHVPSQPGINLYHDLLSHFYSCCLNIVCSDDKARMTFLHFLECIATSLLMRPASESPLLQQCITQLSTVAFDDTMSMEAREKALVSLEKILSYRGAKESNLREYERSCKSWASQMESFPKEKLLPLSIQATRLLVCHRRWTSIVGRKAAISPIVSTTQWINDCLKVALGPFSILRRNAQGILGIIFEAKPREFTHLLTNQVLPLVRREPNENNLKGFFHMINSDYLPCRGQIISNAGLLCRFFEFCAQTLSLPEINSFIGVPELISKCLSAVLFMYHPFRSDKWEQDVNVQKLIEASQGSAASWKLQLFTTIFVGILGDPDGDSKVNEEAVKFLLRAMTLEISQVRSIAVNRGISVLHRYYKQRLEIAYDVDDVDHYGVNPLQPGNASGTSINARPLELMAVEIVHIMPRLCHWLRLETNSTESTPSFRLDCAELFQTFTEIAGPELGTRVSEHLDTATKDVSPHSQRACAEAYSGLCRGSTLKGNGDLDTLGMATKMLAVMRQAGGECAWIWFEASRFMTDSLCPARFLQIYKHALDALSYSNDLGQSSSSTLGVLLYFLAGYVRAGRPVATFVSDLKVKAYALMGVASDATRRSAAFLTVYLMRPSATEGDINEIIGDYSVGRCKAFLTLVELMCLDPVRTGLWSCALAIVTILLRIGEKGEVELQRESRRILRVLAWVALAPPVVAIRLITGILRQLLRTEEPLSPSSIKNVLEFTTLLYSRNFVAFQGDTVRMLLKDAVSLAVWVDLESRRECANLLRLIFHGNPILASEYSQELMPKMKAAMGKIKEPVGVDDRHVLIVTASSLILAFPYDIPSWMPRLLTLLTRFIHDRYPIYETAKSLFSEFKRTHGDGWQQDREKFTENELDAIDELLVAPSYYA